MAITWYVLNAAAVTPNWWGPLQENGSAPTAANTAYGWTPAKTALTTAFFPGRLGATAAATVSQAASYNAAASGPTKGTGSGNTTAGDSFITPNPYAGTFANAVWTFNWNLRAGTAGAVGHVNMRVWKSVNADGSGAAQLLANTAGATVTLSTSADVNSSISWSPGALTLNNEYLFFQVEWQETTQGSSVNNNVLFRAGTASIVSPDFTYSRTISVQSPESVVASKQFKRSFAVLLSESISRIMTLSKSIVVQQGSNSFGVLNVLRSPLPQLAVTPLPQNVSGVWSPVKLLPPLAVTPPPQNVSGVLFLRKLLPSLAVTPPQQLLTAIAQKQASGHTQIISVASAQLVTSIRKATHQLSVLVSSAQNWTSARTVVFRRTIVVASAQFVTLTRAATHRLLLLVASAQNWTLTRTAAFLRTVTLVSAESATLARTALMRRAIVVGTASVMTLVRIASYLRALLVSQGQLWTVNRTAAQVRVFLIGQGELVSLARVSAYLRTLLVDQGQLATLARSASRLLSLPIVSLQSVTLARLPQHFVNAIIAQAQAMTFVRRIASTITVVFASRLTLTPVGKGQAILLVTAGQAITLTRRIVRLLQVVQASLAALQTRAARGVQVSVISPSLATLARLKMALRAILVSSSETATLARLHAVIQSLTLAQAQFVLLARQAAHVLPVAVVSTSLVTLQRRLTRTIAMATGSLSTLAMSTGVRTRSILVSSAEAVMLARTKAIGSTTAFGQSQVVRLTLNTAKTMPVAMVSIVSLARATRHAVLVLSAGFVSLIAVVVRPRTIVFISGEQLTLARSRFAVRLVAIGSNVTLVRTLLRQVSSILSIAQSVSLARRAAKIVISSVAEIVTLRRAITETIAFRTAELVRFVASLTQKHAIVFVTLAKLTLQTVHHVVTTITQNIVLGAGLLVRLLVQIVKARPRTKFLRAWELSTQLQATRTAAAVEALKADVALQVVKSDIALEAANPEATLKVEVDP